MKVNIIFPFNPKKPGGGLRVLFEYANKLNEFGHSIVVYYPCYVSYLTPRTNVITYLKYLYRKFFDNNIPSWFALDKNIEVKFITSINDATIKDGDVILSTWWSLIFDIKNLNSKKGVKFNLIQDIENWLGNDDKVVESYSIGWSNNIVIATYLYQYVLDVTNKPPYKIPFAIDSSKYYVYKKIEKRDPYTICMMYSTEPRKGSGYGLDALKIVKENIPEIKVKLFSIYEKPKDLPDWIEYYYKFRNLTELYNMSAIFLGPSVQEGCALPPMEAMYCGCAVVCTDIDGHKDYAFNNETAILVESMSPADMALKIKDLLNDNNYRINIATKGNTFISKYTWESSAKELELLFDKVLKSK